MEGSHQDPMVFGVAGPKGCPTGGKEEEMVFPLLSYGFHLKMLHALSMWLLNGLGLFGTAGFCLPNRHRTAVLHLCYDGGTVGFDLLDAGGILSFWFANKHCLAGLSFPGGTGAKGLGLFNSFSGFWLILAEGHLEVWDLLPAVGIKGGSSSQQASQGLTCLYLELDYIPREDAWHPVPKFWLVGKSLQGSDHLVQHHLECLPAGTPERRWPLVWWNFLAWGGWCF